MRGLLVYHNSLSTQERWVGGQDIVENIQLA